MAHVNDLFAFRADFFSKRYKYKGNLKIIACIQGVKRNIP